MNSFAGIFWLVLAQLQNQFFVEHLPVAAYVRCLKEKEWKKWNSVFLLYSVWHSSLWHYKVQSGKKEQIKNISASKMKKNEEQPASNKIYWFLKKKRVYIRLFLDLFLRFLCVCVCVFVCFMLIGVDIN